MSKSKKMQLIKRMRNNIIVLVMFILVVVLCTGILRSSLMKNTNKMGLTLVENYSSTEESNIRACESVLTICVDYIEEREKDGVSLKELREGLYPFMDGLTDMYGSDNIQFYGKAMGGTEIMSNDPKIEAMADYDVTNRDYYQGAVEAEGEIYISSVYLDVVTGQPVVTMCKAVPSTGSFMAVDMMFSYFEKNNENLILPQNASYYLIGRTGTLLYHTGSQEQIGRAHV